MARVRRKRVFVNLKDQKEFPTACTGYLWGTKKAAKAKKASRNSVKSRRR